MSRALRRADRLLETLRAQAERHPWTLLLGFALLYFGATALVASRKLPWHDELFTYHISRLASFSEVWRALSTGIEQIPPLFWLITRASTGVFGDGPVGIRLPEMIGFWIMTLGLYRIVAQRSGALYGCLAMLFPLATGGVWYATEGRPYGLLLAFSTLALLAWQAVPESRHRWLAILAIAASLAAALGTHFYAVLLLPALGLGELVRSIRRGRLDLAVWGAILLPLSSLLLYLAQIRAARTYAEHFWARARWKSLGGAYRYFLEPTLLPLIVLVALAALCWRARSDEPAAVDTRRASPLPEEIAAAAGFLAVPVMGMIVAKLVTNAFTPRYVLPAIIGAGILFAWAAHQLLRGRTAPALALLIVLGGSFAVREYAELRATSASAAALARDYDFVESAGAGQSPIVVAEAIDFLRFLYYAPPTIAGRLLHVSDVEGTDPTSGGDTLERSLLELRQFAPVKVEEYTSFVASASAPFLIYGRLAGQWHRLIAALEADGMQVRLLATGEGSAAESSFSSSRVGEAGLPPL